MEFFLFFLLRLAVFLLLLSLILLREVKGLVMVVLFNPISNLNIVDKIVMTKCDLNLSNVPSFFNIRQL